MPHVSLGSLPDDARVWVFAAERALAPAEAEAVLGTVDAFLGVWAAHGHPLRSARELRETRFLIIAVDEAAAGASGCSIDALVREIRGLEPQLGLTLVDHGPSGGAGRAPPTHRGRRRRFPAQPRLRQGPARVPR